MSGVSPEIIQASRWRIAFELLMNVAMLAVLVIALIIDKSNLVAWCLLLWTLLSIFAELGPLAQPARLAVSGGTVAFRGLLDSWSSPADNVADVRCLDGRLLVTFFDPKRVLPEALHPSLQETRQVTGAHFSLSGPFSRSAIERLSKLLPSMATGSRVADPRLVPLARPLVVVPALIVLNVVLFAVMVLTSWNPKTLLVPEIPDLMSWGAQIGALALSIHPWQLLTSTFVHFGMIHLLLNMWVLLKVGGMAERLLGRPGVVVIYLLSGLIGSIAAAVSSPGFVFCGASGAVLGIVGALLAFGWRQANTLPPAIAKSLKFGTLFGVVLTFALGASVSFISQAAHVGGFMAGVVVAWPLARPAEESGFRGQVVRSLAVLAAGLVLIAMTHPHAAHRIHGTADWVRGTLIAFDQISDRFRDTVEKMDESERQGPALTSFVEGEILPRWKEVRGLLEEPEEAAHASEASEVRRVARVYADSWQQMVECALDEVYVLYLAPMLCQQATVRQVSAKVELDRLLR